MTETALVDRYDLVILDLDGVVYLGTEAIGSAVRAIGRLHAQERPYAFATNNAMRRPDEVADLLVSLGVPARTEDVLTSPQAAAALLAERLPAGSAVLVVGTDALRTEVERVGLSPVGSADQAPRAVVQGYGPHVGWAELAEACVAVRGGALWVATNADRTLPSPRGPLPGNGALVAALATALDRQPDAIVGKPDPVLFAQAAKRQGAERPLVVGDRLDTDIEGAHRAGMESLLVLTGVATPADVLAAPEQHRPDLIVNDLEELFEGVPGTGAWRVDRSGTTLELSGGGTPIEALRTLCDAAWAGPGPVTTTAASSDAEAALRALGLSG